MKFTQKEIDLIEGVKKLIYENVASNDDIKELIQKREGKFGYAFMSPAQNAFLNPFGAIKALYSDLDEQVLVNPKFKDDKNLTRILLHETLHAYSKGINCIGFYNNKSFMVTDPARQMSLLDMFMARKNDIAYVYLNQGRVINEAATEFYSSEFSGKEPYAYHAFLPMYANLSKVCGYDNLKKLYFAHDPDGLIYAITKSYHLPNDYLAKKLVMLLDSSFSPDGFLSYDIFKYAYRVFLEINVIKTLDEQKNIKSPKDLKKYINVNDLVTYKNSGSEEDKESLACIAEFLTNELDSWKKLQDHGDWTEIQKVVHEIIRLKKVSSKNDCSEYKEFLDQNMADVLTYINQEMYYKFGGELIGHDASLETVLDVMTESTGKLNMNSLSDFDRNISICNILGKDLDPLKLKYFEFKDIKRFQVENFDNQSLIQDYNIVM